MCEILLDSQSEGRRLKRSWSRRKKRFSYEQRTLTHTSYGRCRISETKIVYPRYDEHFSMSFHFNFFLLLLQKFIRRRCLSRRAHIISVFYFVVAITALFRLSEFRSIFTSMNMCSVCLFNGQFISLPDIFFSRHEFRLSSIFSSVPVSDAVG